MSAQSRARSVVVIAAVGMILSVAITALFISRLPTGCVTESAGCSDETKSVTYSGQFFSADGRPLANHPLRLYLLALSPPVVELRATQSGSFCFTWGLSPVQIHVGDARSTAPRDRRFASVAQRRALGIRPGPFALGEQRWTALSTGSSRPVVQVVSSLEPDLPARCPRLSREPPLSAVKRNSSTLEPYVIGFPIVLVLVALLGFATRRKMAPSAFAGAIVGVLILHGVLAYAAIPRPA